MTASRPTFGFLCRRPAHLLALGFGSGLAPIAPGTVGTLVAIPFDAWLRAYAGDAAHIAAIALLFALGAWSAQVTGRDLGAADHGSIVIDEIVAFLVVLYFVGADPWRQVIAFLLFRVFDIVKPPPIRQLDRALKNGVGVMLDDLLAAAYTLIAFAIGARVLGG
jgi:phosphatidylglycerophosphatase A